MSGARVILITGATRGLGRALVERFAPDGHTVLGCGRSADHVAELRRAFGPPNDFEVVDVVRADAVEAWARRLIGAGAVPELLVNNAALMNDPKPLWEVSAEEFDRLIDVNVKGVVNVIRAFAPAMAARGRGVIVNLSSGWGRSASAGVAPYCASKYAVEGLTKALAQDLPRGMAAVPLNPGVIATDMLRQAWGDAAANYQAPARWAAKAAPFLLRLGPDDNGKSLTVS